MKTKTISKILALVMISLVFAANSIQAQQADPVKGTSGSSYYSNAFGLRLGGTSGITYKHINSNNNAVEVIAGISPYAFSLTGLYERYVPSGVNGLQFYFGGGGHLANSYSYARYRDEYGRNYYYRTYSNGPAIGVDGMMGIEYKIRRAPFAFSFDLKPNVEFVPGFAAYGSIDPALGIKVAF
jgi:hypothetical protein